MFKLCRMPGTLKAIRRLKWACQTAGRTENHSAQPLKMKLNGKVQAHVEMITRPILTKAFCCELARQESSDELTFALLVCLRENFNDVPRPARRIAKVVA